MEGGRLARLIDHTLLFWPTLLLSVFSYHFLIDWQARKQLSSLTVEELASADLARRLQEAHERLMLTSVQKVRSAVKFTSWPLVLRALSSFRTTNIYCVGHNFEAADRANSPAAVQTGSRKQFGGVSAHHYLLSTSTLCKHVPDALFG